MKHRGFEQILNKKNATTIDLPQRADSGSCAYDIKSPYDCILQPGEQKLIWTDVKAYMLCDEVLIMNVRSSQGKLKVQLANTQGWVDSTYYNNPDNEGNIGIFIRNENDVPYVIEEGDKICQGMFIKYLITDDDCPVSESRTGGFGSSGAK